LEETRRDIVLRHRLGRNPYDVAIINDSGLLVAKKRIGDDPAGFAELMELLAEAGDSTDAPVPVAIETPRGLLVAALRATGRPVYATRWRWPAIGNATRWRGRSPITPTR
jgi:hypothetical protein